VSSLLSIFEHMKCENKLLICAINYSRRYRNSWRSYAKEYEYKKHFRGFVGEIDVDGRFCLCY
jgi:hypothetical protein